jgi:hypothetical protein
VWLQVLPLLLQEPLPLLLQRPDLLLRVCLLLAPLRQRQMLRQQLLACAAALSAPPVA